MCFVVTTTVHRPHSSSTSFGQRVLEAHVVLGVVGAQLAQQRHGEVAQVDLAVLALAAPKPCTHQIHIYDKANYNLIGGLGGRGEVSVELTWTYLGSNRRNKNMARQKGERENPSHDPAAQF